MEPARNGRYCRAPTGIGPEVCAGAIDIDSDEVRSPTSGSEERELAHLPKNVLRLMLVIVIVLALVALYANVQRWRRSQLETVIFTPAQTASPSSATP
jgi:hypothetical protein